MSSTSISAEIATKPTSVTSYRRERDRIPSDELAKHQGKWPAFSRDGARVVASSKNLEQLEKKLRAAGEDPQNVVFEFVGAAETVLGGAKLLE